MGVAIDRMWIRQAQIPHTTRPNSAGPPPSVRADRIFAMFRKRLDLTESQAVEVRAILDEVETFFNDVRAKAKPQMDAAMKAADDKIRALLTAKQAPIYETLLEERKRRVEEREWGHHGPPGRHGPLHHLDANNDGQLSKAEIENDTTPKGAHLLERFAEIDENTDGYLSGPELRRARRGPPP